MMFERLSMFAHSKFHLRLVGVGIGVFSAFPDYVKGGDVFG
jgi:ABC-type Mn2+/Zn2+ transport system permease subunit